MKRWAQLRIGPRVNLLIAGASFLALLIAMAGVLAYDVTTVRPRALRDLTAQADIVRITATPALVFGDHDAADQNLAPLAAKHEIAAAVIYDTAGRVFASYRRDPGQQLPPPPRSAAARSEGSHLTVVQRLATDQPLGWLVLQADLPTLWERLPQYSILAGVVLLALLSVSLLLSQFLRDSITAPLDSLAQTARAVSARKDYQLRAPKVSDDEIGQVTGAFNDMLGTIEVTQRALHASSRRLEEAMAAARLSRWSWDPRTDRFEWSDTPGDAAATEPLTSFLDRVHADDRERLRSALIAAADGSPCELDIRLLGPDGRSRWMALRGEYERVREENEPQVFGLALDITERRRLEEQLLQSQKLEAIGRLAGGVAHDFNNLLTAILGYARFALGALPADSPVREDVHQIERAGDRAAALTGQLLAYARRQMVTPRVVSLNDLVDSTGGMLQRIIGEDIRLVTRCAPDLIPARIDPAQFEQVLLNLAVNARDAMPEGGQLTLETSNLVVDSAMAAAHQDVLPGRYVMLAVSDTGSGMDRPTLERIFEPFFTTKEQGKGTGLGLAVCYGIVRQAGGHIWVYSEPGRGATFKVLLPQAEDGSVAESTTGGEAEPVRGGAETVLVVEDEPWVRELTTRVLTERGYHVLTAANGADALELAGQNGTRLDALVTDVVMPGMNGTEVAARLRRLRPELRVVYMSGYAEHAVVQQGVLEDGIAFVSKPFAPDQLARTLRAVLDAA